MRFPKCWRWVQNCNSISIEQSLYIAFSGVSVLHLYTRRIERCPFFLESLYSLFHLLIRAECGILKTIAVFIYFLQSWQRNSTAANREPPNCNQACLTTTVFEDWEGKAQRSAYKRRPFALRGAGSPYARSKNPHGKLCGFSLDAQPFLVDLFLSMSSAKTGETPAYASASSSSCSASYPSSPVLILMTFSTS